MYKNLFVFSNLKRNRNKILLLDTLRNLRIIWSVFLEYFLVGAPMKYQ